MIAGVISDTHGLLRDEALIELEGCALIIHAGDVGEVGILERLAHIAPVTAIRGNTDWGDGVGSLPDTEAVEIAPSTLVYVLHDLQQLDLDPVAAGFRVVVHGHTHMPSSQEIDGVLYFNPGAAGHRRFDLPVTVGRLTVLDDGRIETEIRELVV